MKKKKNVFKVTQKMGEEVELALEEIYCINSAIFDLKMCTIDIEIDEEYLDEFSLVEVYRAVSRSGKFNVLSVG